MLGSCTFWTNMLIRSSETGTSEREGDGEEGRRRRKRWPREENGCWPFILLSFPYGEEEFLCFVTFFIHTFAVAGYLKYSAIRWWLSLVSIVFTHSYLYQTQIFDLLRHCSLSDSMEGRPHTKQCLPQIESHYRSSMLLYWFLIHSRSSSTSSSVRSSSLYHLVFFRSPCVSLNIWFRHG